jgi:hypothetical protein
MMTMKKAFLSVVVALTVVAVLPGCTDNEGCTDPNALNYDAEAEVDNGTCEYLMPDPMLSLRFTFKMGDQDFDYGIVANNWEGRKVRFTLAQFYVSQVRFGDASFPDRYLMITDRQTDYEVGTLPAGMYSGLSFNVGVDSSVNHLDPASFPALHTLSSNNPDHAHWGWNPGYIFMKMEGRVDTTAAINGPADAPFVIHIGLDEFMSALTFTQPVTLQGTATINVTVDWLRLMDNIDLRYDRATDSFNDPVLAGAVHANIPAAFTVE